MIDFACKKFEIENIVKCSLGLTKSDFKILKLLIENPTLTFQTLDISKKLEMDLSTVQRGVKRLREKGLLVRGQTNLPNGYVFEYKIKSKKTVKDMVSEIILEWTKRVEKEICSW